MYQSEIRACFYIIVKLPNILVNFGTVHPHFFYLQGVVLIEDYFKPEEFEPIKKDIEDLVDYLAEGLYEAGKLKGNCQIFCGHCNNHAG